MTLRSAAEDQEVNAGKADEVFAEHAGPGSYPGPGLFECGGTVVGG